MKKKLFDNSIYSGYNANNKSKNKYTDNMDYLKTLKLADSISFDWTHGGRNTTNINTALIENLSSDQYKTFCELANKKSSRTTINFKSDASTETESKEGKLSDEAIATNWKKKDFWEALAEALG